jgi:F-type H+-transporting ATPase subunit epsilon
MVDVVIVTASEVLFKGQAEHVSLPGEAGVFEVWPYHRPLVSRLLPGLILIDEQPMAIRHGVVNVGRNTLTAIVEPA